MSLSSTHPPHHLHLPSQLALQQQQQQQQTTPYHRTNSFNFRHQKKTTKHSVGKKMSTPGLSKCCKIRHIVRLRQMLKRWRNKAAQRRIPSDVPAGYVAVCVGSTGRRFVVRATYLNHPIIKKLLVQAEEEFGFGNQTGPLSIPCDEFLFEEIIRFLSRSESSRFVNLEDFQRNYCHVGLRALADSRPLLEKEVW